MSNCSNSPCGMQAPQIAPAALFQIRAGLSARWNHLVFSIESGPCDWTLRVQESGSNRPLYTAHRGTEAAAKVACMEFGIFQVTGTLSRLRPDVEADGLNWRSYW